MQSTVIAIQVSARDARRRHFNPIERLRISLFRDMRRRYICSGAVCAHTIRTTVRQHNDLGFNAVSSSNSNLGLFSVENEQRIALSYSTRLSRYAHDHL